MISCQKTFILLVLLSFMSCNSRSTSQSLQDGQPQEGLQTATLVSDKVSIIVELARSDTEKSIGLMHRKSLDDGKGMLFIYDADQIMSFWMKNTLIPLSIAFIASDGTIREIYEMKPLSEATVMSMRRARYALEVPLGWFARAGLQAGDKFDLKNVN